MKPPFFLGDREIAGVLIRNGANVNAYIDNATALHITAEKGDLIVPNNQTI